MNLSKYYEEICKYPLLTREEEFDLAIAYKNPDLSEAERSLAKDKIIRANLRFVFKQAKVASKNDPNVFSELILEGNEGLLIGLEGYDPHTGNRFLSYAGWWVYQRIQRCLANMRIVKLPVSKQQLSTSILRMKEANPNITLDQLCEAFPKSSRSEIEELSSTRYLTYYIEDLDPELFEINPIEDSVEAELTKTDLYEAISTLPKKEQYILMHTFGLQGLEVMTMADICAELEISRNEFKNLKSHAIKFLKKEFVGDHLPGL